MNSHSSDEDKSGQKMRITQLAARAKRVVVPEIVKLLDERYRQHGFVGMGKALKAGIVERVLTDYQLEWAIARMTPADDAAVGRYVTERLMTEIMAITARVNGQLQSMRP